MKYFKQVVGEKCYLSPVSTEDAETYCKWLNDISISQYLSPEMRLTIEKERELLKTFSNDNVMFAIVDKETDELIGNCSFMNHDKTSQNAEIGIFIGDKSKWGKGYGSEAMMLLLDYGFNVLNLYCIYLKVLEYNKRAIASYKKCGFREAGRLRGYRYFAGKRHDMLYMDILRDEFDSPFISKLIEK